MVVVSVLLLSLLLLQQPVPLARPESLVDTTWLAAHLNDANIQIVDLRRNGEADYRPAIFRAPSIC
jgi:hypothetical protein